MPRLRLAGALGCIVGFAAIFFAPGQGERYEGLATKVSEFDLVYDVEAMQNGGHHRVFATKCVRSCQVSLSP